jgi:septin family protein
MVRSSAILNGILFSFRTRYQVVGGKGTGKTSLLRLLLETADISPTATLDQQAAIDRFLQGPTKHTQSIQTACVEICESRFDRLLFSVIDTPGLDFSEGRQLKLERQVNGIIKYLDSQYADTMSEVGFYPADSRDSIFN